MWYLTSQTTSWVYFWSVVVSSKRIAPKMPDTLPAHLSDCAHPRISSAAIRVT
jgi:hypothetical protein